MTRGKERGNTAISSALLIKALGASEARFYGSLRGAGEDRALVINDLRQPGMRMLPWPVAVFCGILTHLDGLLKPEDRTRLAERYLSEEYTLGREWIWATERGGAKVNVYVVVPMNGEPNIASPYHCDWKTRWNEHAVNVGEFAEGLWERIKELERNVPDWTTKHMVVLEPSAGK
jgi:hypothetical protein